MATERAAAKAPERVEHKFVELIPPNLAVLDQAWSTLLLDLESLGLLDSTLVVWMGEFGRSAELTLDGERPPARL